MKEVQPGDLYTYSGMNTTDLAGPIANVRVDPADQLVTAATYQHVTREFARAALAVEEKILGNPHPTSK